MMSPARRRLTIAVADALATSECVVEDVVAVLLTVAAGRALVSGKYTLTTFVRAAHQLFRQVRASERQREAMNPDAN